MNVSRSGRCLRRPQGLLSGPRSRSSRCCPPRIAKLVDMTKGGNLRAIRELLDRVLGEPTLAVILEDPAALHVEMALEEKREHVRQIIADYTEKLAPEARATRPSAPPCRASSSSRLCRGASPLATTWGKRQKATSSHARAAKNPDLSGSKNRPAQAMGVPLASGARVSTCVKRRDRAASRAG